MSVKRMRMALPCIAAVALLAGCGDDDEKSGGSGSETTKVAVTASKSGTKYQLEAPASVKAGLVDIELTSDAPPSEQHDVQLIRVEGEHSVAEVLKFIGSEGAPAPEWLFAAGGVGSTAGGATAKVSQVLDAGTYYMLDLGEPEGDNVKSYAEQGATAKLTVTGEASDAELPTAAATITAKDYSFTTNGLKAGDNQIVFDNTGKELHHVLAVPYGPGATFADVKKFATSDAEPTGPPPIQFEKAVNTAVLEGGTKQTASLKLEAGKYAFLCFISDRAGGPPHVAKGMISEVVIP